MGSFNMVPQGWAVLRASVSVKRVINLNVCRALAAVRSPQPVPLPQQVLPVNQCGWRSCNAIPLLVGSEGLEAGPEWELREGAVLVAVPLDSFPVGALASASLRHRGVSKWGIFTPGWTLTPPHPTKLGAVAAFWRMRQSLLLHIWEKAVLFSSFCHCGLGGINATCESSCVHLGWALCGPVREQAGGSRTGYCRHFDHL